MDISCTSSPREPGQSVWWDQESKNILLTIVGCWGAGIAAATAVGMFLELCYLTGRGICFLAGRRMSSPEGLSNLLGDLVNVFSATPVAAHELTWLFWTNPSAGLSASILVLGLFIVVPTIILAVVLHYLCQMGPDAAGAPIEPTKLSA